MTLERPSERMQQETPSLHALDGDHDLNTSLFDDQPLPSYAGAALAKTPVGRAVLLVAGFWVLSTVIVLFGASVGGIGGALVAAIAVLALYLASGLTALMLRRWELRKIQELVDVLNNTSQRLANLSILD